MKQIPKELERFAGAVRERVRQAIARSLEEAARTDKHVVKVSEVRAIARCEMGAASAGINAWREGKVSLADSWADEPDEGGEATLAELEGRVRAAKTDADREALAHELAALLAGGRVAPEVAREIRGALGDARASAEKKRGVEPAADVTERMALVGDREAQAALALFYMVGDARRERLFGLIEAELTADMAEHPNVDAMGGQQ